MSETVSISLLGPLAIARGGQPLPDSAWRSRQERRLLGALLTFRGAGVTVERLLAWLWPGADPSASTVTLRSAISSLRRTLEPARSSRASDRFILTRPGGYAWNVEAGAWIDVDEFVSLTEPLSERWAAKDEGKLFVGSTAPGLQAPTSLAASSHSLAEALERAVALYRGDYLEDEVDAPWAITERERLRERYFTAVQALTELRIERDQLGGAIALARQGLERDALREPLWRALMRAQALAGDNAGALQSYERYRHLLDEALGAMPSEQTRELHGAILRGQVERARPADRDSGALGQRAAEERSKVLVTPPSLSQVAMPAPPLVGRRKELAALHGWIDTFVHGHGGIVTVMGEAGIGKTRLAEQARQLAIERGALAITVHATAMEHALPFGPLSEALRPLLRAAPEAVLRRLPRAALAQVAELIPLLRDRLPDLPTLPPAPPIERHNWLLDGLVDLALALSQEQPLVLICDDAQWADEATLTAIGRLARRAARRHLLIVLTYRPEELAESPALHALLRSLGREMLLRPLLLERLREPDVADLLAELANVAPDRTRRLAARLVATTGGNPLFVSETVQALLETHRADSLAALLAGRSEAPPLPDLAETPRIRDLVLARVARLPDDARLLLDQLAVVGRPASLDLVERLASPSGLDAAQTLLDRHFLIEGDDGRLGFAHDLVRSIVVAELSSPRRRQLHRQAADAISALHGRLAERAAELALHFEAAGRGAEAETLRYATIAGDRARRSFGYRQALEHYAAALRAAEHLGTVAPADQVRRAFVGRLMTCEALLDWDGISATAAAYDRWAASRPDPLPPLVAARRLILLRALTGDLAGASEMSRRQSAVSSQQSPMLAELLRRTATVLEPEGPLDSPEGDGESFVAFPEQPSLPGDCAAELPELVGPDEATLALFQIGWATLMQGGLREARPCLESAYRLGLETGQAAAAVVSALQLAHLSALHGDDEATGVWLERSLDLAQQAPEAAWASIWPRIYEGFLWLLDDRLDAAQERFEAMAEQLAVLPAFQSHRASVQVGLGLVALARSDLPTADRLFREAQTSSQLLYGFVAIAAKHGEARLAALRGDLGLARRVLAGALRASARRGLLPEYVRTAIEIARIERDFGTPARAVPLLETAAALAEGAGMRPLAEAASALLERLQA